MRLLDHSEEAVRAAAADALGYVYLHLHTSAEVAKENSQNVLNVDPPINILPLLPSHEDLDFLNIDPKVRSRLAAMMLGGKTDAERRAAAGALLNWPPANYQFRYAEWGVWLDDGGDLKLVQSVLDEIPPFVHRTGNPMAEFRSRINQIMIITKPIAHLTVDQPLSIDLEVQIRNGRPWYAFPRPDDFAFEAGTLYGRYRTDAKGVVEAIPPEIRSLSLLDPPKMPLLTPLGEGYSWRLPRHRSVGSHSGSMGAMGNEMASMGLRWQSLIVTPDRETWMVPPEVGEDPKFSWWTALRKVPSSWISSHGETERFLYYDGPSFAHSPLSVCSDGKQLTILTHSMLTAQQHFVVELPAGDRHQPSRSGFLIEVEGGKVATQEFAIPGLPGEKLLVELSPKCHSSPNLAVQALLSLLVKEGLTKEEAGGLIACWRKQFFETPGRRLLTILSREDYDEICPLTIRPTPTKTVRVGIVLTELAE